MCRRRADLMLENLALQQQVAELNKQRPRPTLDDAGRRDKSTSIELCTSLVAKLECHLINTTAQLQTP